MWIWASRGNGRFVDVAQVSVRQVDVQRDLEAADLDQTSEPKSKCLESEALALACFMFVFVSIAFSVLVSMCLFVSVASCVFLFFLCACIGVVVVAYTMHSLEHP